MVTLTAGQAQGLEMIRSLEKYERKPKVAVLAGFAGTGKTFLLKEISGLFGGQPVFLAPTGKAAVRVQEATGRMAKTIHSWMYDAQEDINTGDVTYSPKDPSNIDTGEVPLVVIDEASMVGETIWEDVYDTLMVIRSNVLLVGDPFQLPPVQEETKSDEPRPQREFSLLSEHFDSDARVSLTEIVRQAQDSPIVKATMMIRDGMAAKAVMALPRINKSELQRRATQIYEAGGMTIAHKNATRMKLNTLIRGQQGRAVGTLAVGEPLLVLQNSIRIQIFNGEVITFTGWESPPGASHRLYDTVRREEGQASFGLAMSGERSFYISPERVFGQLEKIRPTVFHKRVQGVYGNRITDEDTRRMSAAELAEKAGPPFVDASLGYVLTCHKAQGSEWGDVLVCLESSVNTRQEEGLRWLYTSLTRAKRNVTICLGGVA